MRWVDSTLEITWVNRGLIIVRINNKSVEVGGEVLLEHDPDFMIFARSVTKWSDGTPITEAEKVALLDEVVKVAAERGWKFEISWASLNLPDSQ
jgi:hypothetical protein